MSDIFTPSYHKTALKISEWEHNQVTAGITTRLGGYSEPPFDSMNMGWHVNDNPSHVQQNYVHLEKYIQIPMSNWVSGKQVHGITTLTIIDDIHMKERLSPSNYHENIECDGYITNLPNVILTAVFADCVPLFFYARNSDWIGLAHAGWRGTVQGIGKEMINSFLKQGVPISDIRIAIGPAICQEHYEVDEKVVHNIPPAYRHNKVLAASGSHNRYKLNLKELNKQLLIETGLTDEQIIITKYCSYHDEELFYSHRRDGGHTGRMMAYITKKK